MQIQFSKGILWVSLHETPGGGVEGGVCTRWSPRRTDGNGSLGPQPILFSSWDFWGISGWHFILAFYSENLPCDSLHISSMILLATFTAQILCPKEAQIQPHQSFHFLFKQIKWTVQAKHHPRGRDCYSRGFRMGISVLLWITFTINIFNSFTEAQLIFSKLYIFLNV